MNIVSLCEMIGEKMQEFKSRDLATPQTVDVLLYSWLNSDGTLLLNDYFIVPWCLHGTPRYFKEYYGTKTILKHMLITFYLCCSLWKL